MLVWGFSVEKSNETDCFCVAVGFTIDCMCLVSRKPVLFLLPLPNARINLSYTYNGIEMHLSCRGNRISLPGSDFSLLIVDELDFDVPMPTLTHFLSTYLFLHTILPISVRYREVLLTRLRLNGSFDVVFSLFVRKERQSSCWKFDTKRFQCFSFYSQQHNGSHATRHFGSNYG